MCKDILSLDEGTSIGEDVAERVLDDNIYRNSTTTIDLAHLPSELAEFSILNAKSSFLSPSKRKVGHEESVFDKSDQENKEDNKTDHILEDNSNFSLRHSNPFNNLPPELEEFALPKYQTSSIKNDNSCDSSIESCSLLGSVDEQSEHKITNDSSTNHFNIYENGDMIPLYSNHDVSHLPISDREWMYLNSISVRMNRNGV